MFINTPPITLSCTRTGANANPNDHLFVIPTVHDNSGRPVKAGDFCVLGDLANNDNPSYPTAATPTGFTNLFAAQGVQGSGNYSRAQFSAKILTAADIGATKTGMVGGSNCRKCLATFDMNRPVQSFSFAGGFQDGPQATDVVNWGIYPVASLGTILSVHMGLGESAHTPASTGIIGSTPYNVSGTDDTGFTSTPTKIYYSMYPFGTAPGVTTFNMADASVNYCNWTAGGYFILL